MVDRNWNNIEKCSILYDLSPIKNDYWRCYSKNYVKSKNYNFSGASEKLVNLYRFISCPVHFKPYPKITPQIS
jgi:hypothetical protein